MQFFFSKQIFLPKVRDNFEKMYSFLKAMQRKQTTILFVNSKGKY